MKLREIAKDIFLKKLFFENNYPEDMPRLKCIYDVLSKELAKYENSDKDDRWADMRGEQKNIEYYLKNGYFISGTDDDYTMDNFLADLDYSNTSTYKRGDLVKYLSDNTSNVPVYKAEGTKVLFRGVSVADWKRIKSQGYIDSDMRGAIMSNEGINLGQIPSTAKYYLPADGEGVILAISPKNLDLYMLKDEYIRVFDRIPMKNVIKVSDIFVKDKYGALVSRDVRKNIVNIIDRLTRIGINVDC